MSESIINRIKVNILEPYDTKQIMDRQVLELFKNAREQGKCVVGTFRGWTENPIIPDAGHLMFVVKAEMEPAENVNHTRWLNNGLAICEDPKNDHFVVNDHDPEKQSCTECLMRLMALNRPS